ncbi:MAG TPA: hypothetical protein VFO11_01660 [Candidatus Polarisedimenticolaceae bacterium]|nr:hypothetical protein [Candidatus Polarisedimenticolaceae bacterium]
MSSAGWFVLALMVALPILLIAEGKRQERRYGKGSGRGSALLRAGMLETQRLLEPERKVEILQLKEERAAEAAPEKVTGLDI